MRHTPALLSHRAELWLFAFIGLASVVRMVACATVGAEPPDLNAVVTPRVLELAPGITYEPNPSTGSAAWVAEWVTVQTKAGAADRPSRFTIDKNLPVPVRATQRDYTHSGYDRGHLAASANWGDDRAQTFNLANVAPQVPEMNQGPMKFLEESLATKVDAKTSLLIVTAPIYQLGRPPRFAGRLPVPTAFVKAVLVFEGSKPIEGLAYQIDNVRGAEIQLTTIDAIETLLQRDLFAELPDDVEARLESR